LSRLAVPISVPFSEKVTVPPLTGDPFDETITVKVTGSPEKMVVGEYVSTVVVGARMVKTALVTALCEKLGAIAIAFIVSLALTVIGPV
jgi:hypothetical protein